MIVLIYGTTAEAIKLAPIVKRLRSANAQIEQWVTFQHTDSLIATMKQTGLGKPDEIVAFGNRNTALEKPLDFAGWLLQCVGWAVRNRRRVRRRLPANTIVLVHGDTMTSVVGALIARFFRLRCGHVEAGLRSGDWRHPFPEELDRRIVGRLAHVHYAPSEQAVANLGARTGVVYTHGNTVNDAVKDRVQGETDSAEPYGVVLLHRFELMSNTGLLEESLRCIGAHTPCAVKVIVDTYSRPAIEAMLERVANPQFVVEGKKTHSDFMDMLQHAEYVITDSGGVQEETALLGVPTLVHRLVSERDEGLGDNVRLSLWDMDIVSQFLDNYAAYRTAGGTGDTSPSDIIVQDLKTRGYV